MWRVLLHVLRLIHLKTDILQQLFLIFLSLHVISCAAEVKEEKVKVCYELLGCFEAGDCPVPYGKWGLKYMPVSPVKVNTTFTLYGPESNISTISYLDFKSWSKVKKGKIALLIHGFGEIGPELIVLKNALLLQNLVHQVIVVDWMKGSTFPYYFYAATNTQLVGRQIGWLLYDLHLNQGLRLKDVHLIGFSLGAHVAGYAGKMLTNFGQKIGRITALDAAAPYFENTTCQVSTDDALFVDAIHTNMDKVTAVPLNIGSKVPFAHVDFYPNGGGAQTHCKGRFWDVKCNHVAAINFYISSIRNRNQCSFSATPCNSDEPAQKAVCGSSDGNSLPSAMGYYSINYSGRGAYYLETTKYAPYCID